MQNSQIQMAYKSTQKRHVPCLFKFNIYFITPISSGFRGLMIHFSGSETTTDSVGQSFHFHWVSGRGSTVQGYLLNPLSCSLYLHLCSKFVGIFFLNFLFAPSLFLLIFWLMFHQSFFYFMATHFYF